MRVVRPAAVTPLTLIASNVPEDDAPAWAAGTYALGAQVVRDHHLWESLAASNTAIPGSETTSPLKWLDLGPVNRWLMFDKKAGTKWLIGKSTQHAESIDVTIRPGSVVNAVGMVGVRAVSVQVIVTDPADGVVYDRTVIMADVGVSSWYDYWFSPIGRRDNMALFDLPAYGTADVQVIASAPSGTAQIGTLVLGGAVEIGDAVYGTGLGIAGYTRTDIDEFGNVTLVPRGSRRVVDYDIRIPTDTISMVMRLLNSLRDTASLYVGKSTMDATIIVGRFEQLQTVISNPAFCEMSLEVRSLE